MAEESKEHLWHLIHKILPTTLALVTALTGLVVALNQTVFFNDDVLNPQATIAQAPVEIASVSGAKDALKSTGLDAISDLDEAAKKDPGEVLGREKPPTPKDVMQSGSRGGHVPAGSRYSPFSSSTSHVEASSNRDEPTVLRSNEIRGAGVGKELSQYYTFYAGPGSLKIITDAKNKPSAGNIIALGVVLMDTDNNQYLNININKRKDEYIQLDRRTQFILHILLLSNKNLPYAGTSCKPRDLAFFSNRFLKCA